MSEKDHPQYSKEELWEILKKWLEEREEKMKGHRGKLRERSEAVSQHNRISTHYISTH